jgi:L-fuculose-phosphate aldolase
MDVKPGGLADIIVEALKQHHLILVHGHGSFAIGQLLEEAHNYTATLEESCRVICLLKSLQVSAAKK